MTLDRTDLTAGRPSVVAPLSPLPPLPWSLWDGHEVREAVRTRSPGAVVAIARRAHGLRQDELGSLAGFSQSAISRLEAGSNIAYDLRVLRPLQRLLGIPAHLLGLADGSLPVAGRDLDRLAPGFGGGAAGRVVGLDPDSMTAFASATVSGDGAGDVVSRLLVLRRIVNDAHNWRSSDALMPTARAMYDYVDGLRRSARGEQRRALLGVAALYAEFLGWLHEETDDPRGAFQWTGRALEQGQAADDRDVVAYSYVRLSQLAAADGDTDRVIGLARAAGREHDVSPMVRSLALRQEARGLALAGDEASCMDRLDRADEEYRRVEPASDEEYWIGYCSTTDHFEAERAASWLELGEPVRAIGIYEEVRRRAWPRMCTWEQGVHVAKLAHAHREAGEHDHAAALAYEALETARATKSAHVLRELGRLGEWEGARDVAELAAAVR
ncbi:helix-turn-helix transcriptional regulator [Actinosynnema sp. NPDC023658]|uniref:helix-turn-helix transcriptional regulator n=1 Tax=Actinosynnema sp. NPDC023658 TaxID=3155465 RepID=UPI0033F9541A